MVCLSAAAPPLELRDIANQLDMTRTIVSQGGNENARREGGREGGHKVNAGTLL